MADPRRQDLKARAFRLSELALEVCERMALDGPRMAHIADQLFRAVSGIGALLEEGEVASSRRDMAAKYAIALREAREGNYWSRLGSERSKWARELAPIVQETKEFVAMLTVAVRKLRTPPPEDPAE